MGGQWHGRGSEPAGASHAAPPFRPSRMHPAHDTEAGELLGLAALQAGVSCLAYSTSRNLLVVGTSSGSTRERHHPPSSASHRAPRQAERHARLSATPG